MNAVYPPLEVERQGLVSCFSTILERAEPLIQAFTQQDIWAGEEVRTTSPLRVALLTNFLPPYFVPVLQNLAQRVAELQVFISTPMESNRSWVPNWDGLRVTVQRAFTVHSHWKHQETFSDRVFVHLPVDTIALLGRFHPDVIVSAGFGLRTLQSCLYRGAHPSKALVIWINCSERTEIGVGKFRTLLRRGLLRSRDRILTNGASGARYLESLGVPSEDISCLPYVREMSALLSIDDNRDSSESRRLLFVGQLTDRKGVQLLLPALGRWQRSHPEQPVELWVAGDGPQRQKLKLMAEADCLRVKFLGHVGFSDLPSIYAGSGLLVFPTLADEWGIVVNEALAAGVPVLGSRYSQAVQELVKDGQNGWTFLPDNPAQLYGALDRALSCPSSELLRMRQFARASVRQLTPEFGCDQLLDAIIRAHNSRVRPLQRGL